MIDLDKVKLSGSLSFMVPPDPEDRRKLGICVVEESRDEKARRFHNFSTKDGVYKGFYDKDVETGVVRAILQIIYKRKNTAGDHVYIVKRYEMSERMVQVGEPEVVSEESLPRIEVDEQNIVHLIGGDKLEHIDPPETSLERLEGESLMANRTIAELTDTSGYLNDTLTEVAQREAQKVESISPNVAPATEPSYSPEPEVMPESDPSQEGDEELEEGTNQRRMIY